MSTIYSCFFSFYQKQCWKIVSAFSLHRFVFLFLLGLLSLSFSPKLGAQSTLHPLDSSNSSAEVSQNTHSSKSSKNLKTKLSHFLETQLAFSKQQHHSFFELIDQLQARRQFSTWLSPSQITLKKRSPTQLKSLLHSLLMKEYGSSYLKGEEALFKHHRLLSPQISYLDTLLHYMSQGAGGLYSPTTQTLYLSSKLPLEQSQSVLMHEIFHALQDQEWKSGQWVNPQLFTHDALHAHQIALEGDAMIEMMWPSLGDVSRSPHQLFQVIQSLKNSIKLQFPDMPRLIEFIALSPYIEGLKWIWTLRQKGWSWKQMNQIYHAPPQSTEQILHPELYLSQHLPIKVYFKLFPVSTPKNSKLPLWKGTLGELYFRFLFSAHLSKSESEQAAQGWGGDWTVANDQSTCTLSIWDTEIDAVDAYQALLKWIKSTDWIRYSNSTEPKEDTSSLQAKRLFFQRKGSWIGFCLGPHAHTFMKKVWKSCQSSSLSSKVCPSIQY